ncbi:alpha-amylase [Romeria aff. gracilis LEGE 07310]|uniref:Alpha-amylase n=1 Tax=Vasconcelosia minhoensis LEGE 07310 TaxID=915328 RepID=A0A8J7AID4_9CYAN|nr:glucosylglycerol hydrolase [Romeria gracilis]MBE9079529.1 alpha-amylase [Romeria aff. gracilis LEGE 07310]
MVATVSNSKQVRFVEDETQSLVAWADSINRSDATYFNKAQKLAHRLGAKYRSDRLTEIGFWTPEFAGDIIQSEHRLELEIFTPLDPLDFRAPQQTVRFQRDLIPITKQGEFVWAVIYGMQAGTRHQAGCFYWLRYEDADGRVRVIRDPLAYSLPYGVFAPAELYDMRQLQRRRADLAYFRQTGSSSSLSDATPPRVPAPTNILQIHVKTASAEGTLEGLTRIYQRISDKLAAGESLTPDESVYAGYDAVQLLPVEPTIEYRREDTHGDYEFFAIAPYDPDHDSPLTVTLRQPDTQNWGYDVPILGSGATNPAVLGSLRPDEVVDFIATLHNFSQGPIQLIYDLVYGHADNQSLELLNHQYHKGPNMYGQDLNHQSPQVRAILLEMQRRKINTGADGVRVDGGQDFRFFNPLSDRVEQDDAYLMAMSDVVQTIQGCRRLMFTIFEDGRPWPQEGWEEISRYRELIELKPNSFQWGPLIFAHNTPTLKGFWDRKWRRACEVIFQGNRWITGCGNHDTVRRGNQVALDRDINWNLGKTLPQVLHTAYNSPATQIWVQGFSPGLPMDFLNACVGAAWGFFRNTDDRYGVKVVAEEVGFLDWQVEPERYARSETFPRLKQLGFYDLEQLRAFAKALQTAMEETDYDLDAVAEICRHCLGADANGYCEIPALEDLNEPNLSHFLATLDVPKLKSFAMAFMEDGHDLCNVARYAEDIDPNLSYFNLALRNFRRRHPWLQENLTGRDRFNRVSDDRRTIFYGLRTCPDQANAARVAMVAHMGGEPLPLDLEDWLQIDFDQWQIAIATPDLLGLDQAQALRSFVLHDGQGILLEPRGPVALAQSEAGEGS